VFYAGFQIFSRLAGGKIDGFLVPIIINLVAVFIPLFVYVQQKAKGSTFLATTRPGLVYAVFAGASIALFAISFAKIFQKSGNLAFVSPIIFGGSILLSTLFGALLLKEQMSPLHIVGFIAILFGIGLIILAKA
jgi:uncharacterized membrane protein